MYKLILTLFFLYSSAVYTRTNSVSVTEKSKEPEKLLKAVSLQTGNYSIQPDLTDFLSRAQSVMSTMYPAGSILNLRCEKLTDMSLSSAEALRNYFLEIYKDDIDMMREGWTEKIISEFMNRNALFGIMQWDIFNNGVLNTVRSVAVFDENRKVLYDTKLAEFTLYSESDEVFESDSNLSAEIKDSSPLQVSAVNNDSSQTRSRTLTVSNIFGSVQLRYIVTVTAIVPPYITASTNDAEYNYYTNSISCTRINPSGIPPTAEPFLYFGTGGDYAVFYENATPSESPVTITGGTGDRFNNGLYNISGSNGQNWTFSFDFSVDFPGGSIGITPQSNISALSLSAVNNSSIKLGNYVYNPASLRAVFFDGGSLNADNFRILTGAGSGEKGKVRITSKLRAGYINSNANPVFFDETSAGFDIPVQYLRGDHVFQPGYQLTSTRYNIPIGQIDTLKAKIINNSHAVKLSGGNISIDVSSLSSMLTMLSPATLSIGTIDTSASKEFKFAVRGNSNGIVTPQIIISAMGWESPVPPTVLINNVASIDSNIDVSPLIKTLTLTAPIQGFYNASSNSIIRDTVGIYLRNAASPFAIADSAKAYLSTSYTGTYAFSKAVNYTQYYIQTKHRNSIETWSKTPQFFINSELSYDFSTSNTQAYGDNLVLVNSSPIKYAVYNGDVNQNGNIDLSDVLQTYNSAITFTAGYVVSDLNGDSVVDLNDILITYNNSTGFIRMVMP